MANLDGCRVLIVIEAELTTVVAFEIPFNDNGSIQRHSDDVVLQRNADAIPIAILERDTTTLNRAVDQDVVRFETTVRIIQCAAVGHPMQLHAVGVKQEREAIERGGDMASPKSGLVPELVVNPFAVQQRPRVVQTALLDAGLVQTRRRSLTAVNHALFGNPVVLLVLRPLARLVVALLCESRLGCASA